jgi:uncharacterized membrane protein SpoIIM required for sporulation
VRAFRRYLIDAASALIAFIASTVPFALLGRDDPRLVHHLGFAYVPHQWSQTVVILEINAHHLWLPLLIVATLIQARWELRTELGRRQFIRIFDFGVICVVGFVWALPVGVAVGAYGSRMIRAMLPAGPIELGAYALAASVYLQSRRTRILYLRADRIAIERRDARRAAGVALLSGVLLVIAALVETFA